MGCHYCGDSHSAFDPCDEAIEHFRSKKMGDNGFSEFAKATFLPTFGKLTDAQELQYARDRIAVLESALLLMVHMVDESRSDSEGHYPTLDSGCNECTQGSTPLKYDTGKCAYHLAQRILLQKSTPATPQLLGAAPDLLSALRGLLEECNRHGSFAEVGFDHPMVEPFFDAARRAIAKATL